MSEKIIITNNCKVFERYHKEYDIVLLKSRYYLDVLKQARDLIHDGAKLLTHPMSGSLKPNQTPYLSLIILKEEKGIDFESLRLIENSIEAAMKFMGDKELPSWHPEIEDDFRTIDLSILESAIKK